MVIGIAVWGVWGRSLYFYLAFSHFSPLCYIYGVVEAGQIAIWGVSDGGSWRFSSSSCTPASFLLPLIFLLPFYSSSFSLPFSPPLPRLY
jgi:hypothetical protein